ncbi:MAG: hypothetical protein K1060chlam5_00655 [Candidatus Anoxychlamydiales bacterium]|nr:hypothetical protein [Candidatus Anoxychlamydiales bacterium]
MNLNNFKRYLFLFSIFFSFLYSYEKPFTIKAKLSDFFYQDSSARKIFKNYEMLTSFEGSYEVYKYSKVKFHAFVEYGFLKADGFDKNTLTIFKLFLSPLSFGLNTEFIVNNTLSIYLKTAPNWMYAQVKHDYEAPPNKISKSTIGGTFGLGLLVHLNDRAVFDLFFNYLYDSKKITDSSSEVTFKPYFGGFQLGYGLGIKF